MRTSAHRIAPLFVMLHLLAASSATALEVPKDYPEFDDETATALLVIATLEPGKEFPEDDEPCGGMPESTAPTGDGPTELDAICIPLRTPFWMRADVRWSLVGDVPAGLLLVSSASHYKTPGHDDLAGEVFLLPLKTDGTSYLTWDRQWAVLHESRWGEL